MRFPKNSSAIIRVAFVSVSCRQIKDVIKPSWRNNSEAGAHKGQERLMALNTAHACYTGIHKCERAKKVNDGLVAPPWLIRRETRNTSGAAKRARFKWNMVTRSFIFPYLNVSVFLSLSRCLCHDYVRRHCEFSFLFPLVPVNADDEPCSRARARI